MAARVRRKAPAGPQRESGGRPAQTPVPFPENRGSRKLQLIRVGKAELPHGHRPCRPAPETKTDAGKRALAGDARRWVQQNRHLRAHVTDSNLTSRRARRRLAGSPRHEGPLSLSPRHEGPLPLAAGAWTLRSHLQTDARTEMVQLEVEGTSRQCELSPRWSVAVRTSRGSSVVGRTPIGAHPDGQSFTTPQARPPRLERTLARLSPEVSAPGFASAPRGERSSLLGVPTRRGPAPGVASVRVSRRTGISLDQKEPGLRSGAAGKSERVRGLGELRPAPSLSSGSSRCARG